MYCNNFIKYTRRQTTEVCVGNIKLGGNNPIRIQTMTNVRTEDVTNTVAQIVRSTDVGAEIVRVTVPSLKDIEALRQIKQKLVAEGNNVPVVADVHFNASIALAAAELVDKVRVNPGNYIDKRSSGEVKFSDAEYAIELQKLKTEFSKLIAVCKKHNTAIRIGTNHGSLSERIVSKYGDTIEGMVESSMEFLRVCKEMSFSDLVISMKSSNTRVMVYSTRLLVEQMAAEGMAYPVHLGVTEAGEGEDGRIKSAVGIGALLSDGIGDTIRVSLTEEPEAEIPVARKIVDYIAEKANHNQIMQFSNYSLNPYSYSRRYSRNLELVGGNIPPIVIAKSENAKSDFICNTDETLISFANDKVLKSKSLQNSYSLLNISDLTKVDANEIFFVEAKTSQLTQQNIETLKLYEKAILVLESENKNILADIRASIINLINANCHVPIIVRHKYNEHLSEDLQIKAAIDFGGIFIDGLADGLWIDNDGKLTDDELVSVSFGILQASRVRMTKTEYISCPSCGRTLFNLQETAKLIRQKTSHLTGLKIGIMGCIVNGPGEMADADYGYVGAAAGRITLYKNQELIKRNIPQEVAVDELINLIKENGDWKEPE